MRIEEDDIAEIKNRIKKTVEQRPKNDDYYNDDYDDYDDRWPAKKKKNKKSEPKTLKFCSCLILTVAVIVLIAYGTIKFIVQPVMIGIEESSDDLTKDITLYKLDEANIKIQSSHIAGQITKMLKSTSDSVKNFLWQKITEKFEKKTDKVKSDLTEASVENIKKVLQNANFEDSKTTIVQWVDLDKNKEELSQYYKKELAGQGFEFKENITDYDINLGFFKDDVFGTMIFSDSTTTGRSLMEMVINYLKN